MDKKLHFRFNPYFTFPFLAWIVAGGLLLVAVGNQDLFLSINGQHTASADVLMYYTTWMGQAEIIIPLLMMMMFIPRFRNWWYFLAALSCNIIPFFVQQLLKSWLNLPRPMYLYSDTPGVHYLAEWPLLLRGGFPSGHSQGACSFFCFLSLLLPARRRWWGLLFFVMAMMVCYSRIYLAAHFFDDVYAGSILGVALTTLIFALMDKFRPNLKEQNIKTL